MARLKKGEKPVPHKDRLKLYRAELEKAGGRRLNVDLGKDAAKAIDKIMEKRGVTTAKDAVSLALIEEAKRS